jgi:hypothetical protein
MAIGNLVRCLLQNGRGDEQTTEGIVRDHPLILTGEYSCLAVMQFNLDTVSHLDFWQLVDPTLVTRKAGDHIKVHYSSHSDGNARVVWTEQINQAVL